MADRQASLLERIALGVEGICLRLCSRYRIGALDFGLQHLAAPSFRQRPGMFSWMPALPKMAATGVARRGLPWPG